ncbi:TetR/AcrR family transcriptional regulator C-terminal domain-containing protein [Jiella mangrovi]|uniref:TetR/AcrR family transcriptional regulator C-terminal domain-containing protein n=1 Tax=Jiella mangrovi TaxID=2821407 RepID=A0ABS4BJ71_9HYPH|nr:TetR/AcrR family transcriptional regulator C-terminal domain-containing protein [Jiella mangrovi]MBP0616818.1 TetR/AcrR family transcriptional regulator C-terminal domain-containing protein [Jiella mangrovi]
MDLATAFENETGKGGAGDGPTARQVDVLDAALALIVDPKATLTMSSLARAASCSKESLYKWFGDRDGLLTAMVQWQAAKVRGLPVGRSDLDRKRLLGGLEAFAADWLTVLASETSVALNRLAVGEAASGGGRNLGRIVLQNGPVAMGRRLAPLLQTGREAGLLAFEDGGEAFRDFFGLVVRDVQIRLLLGDRIDLSPADIRAAASRAARHFMALYGADQRPDGPQRESKQGKE